jgi:hypothetical protein
MNIKKTLEQKEKILLGLDKAFEQLIEFKKYKKTDLVILKDQKITRVKP